MGQLTASGVTLESLLLRHLLHSAATLKQRATVLRLLHMSLAPHLDLSTSTVAQPADGSRSHGSSSSNYANAADLDASVRSQDHAGFQGSVESQADQQDEPSLAGQALTDSESGGSEQLCIKLFKMVLEVLPSVIKSAACTPADPSSDGEQASDAAVQSAQTDAQQAQGVENSDSEVVEQDAEAEAVDGNAMHALLSLILRVATHYGYQGLLAVLAFPTALGPILPEMLASPQVSCPHIASVFPLASCTPLAFVYTCPCVNNAALTRRCVLHWCVLSAYDLQLFVACTQDIGCKQQAVERHVYSACNREAHTFWIGAAALKQGLMSESVTQDKRC